MFIVVSLSSSEQLAEYCVISIVLSVMMCRISNSAARVSLGSGATNLIAIREEDFNQRQDSIEQNFPDVYMCVDEFCV